jgi:formamidopyrimidine-DNA glycosylase
LPVPELPDIAAYIEALATRIGGKRLLTARILHPFLLRTFDPPLSALHGLRSTELLRIGKRVAIGFEGDRWLLMHLMIAGRLHWSEAGTRPKGRGALARFAFETGTLVLTEAGTKRRASIGVYGSRAQLATQDPGGLGVLDAALEDFRERLVSANHTLKRALTDPRLFSGIGNAYSDEILHRARLSPIALTQRLEADEIGRLHAATRAVLTEWTERLLREAAGAFPERVTAFRKGMAVHGRYGEPCPVCGTAVQRIRYAENETHYCPRCQTDGKILADRSLSRLLKDDWPRTIEELELE